MPKVLSREQIEQYHEEGFIAPIDIMSEDEATAFLHRLEAAERDHPEMISGENRADAHLAFMFADELAFHPRVLDAVEDLIGPAFSFFTSVLFVKEPNTRSFVSWHQDATYMGMSRNDFPTTWLALNPSNRETGCMTMIPGSHKDPIRPHEDTFGEDNILTRGQQVQGVDESSGVDLILRPGQMSIHHCRTIHGSQPNLSNQRRIGFATQSFITHDIRQEIGENRWVHARGEPRSDAETVFIERPKFDLDPAGVAEREKSKANLDKILYHGAEMKRAY